MQDTFVIPVIRTDLLDRCLETLSEGTPPGLYVYVVAQSPVADLWGPCAGAPTRHRSTFPAFTRPI